MLSIEIAIVYLRLSSVIGMSKPEPTTLTLRDPATGEVQYLPLLGPGGPIRAVVGEPGRQSGVWRIWSPPNKFDVYVAVRVIADMQKWSFHETGDWRFQWIFGDKTKHLGIDNRIIDQWQRPDEDPETGIQRCFSIRVRHQDLIEVADPEAVPDDALWVPPPAEGLFLTLHLAIVRPGKPEFALTGLVPLAGYSLVDGRVLLVLGAVEQQSDQLNEQIEAAIAASVKTAADNGADLTAAKAPRVAASGHDEHGNRFVWDVALPTGAVT